MLCGTDKELLLCQSAAADFAAKLLAPGREEHDKYPFGTFWDPVLEKAHELELFSSLLPEDMDGLGQGLEALGVILSRLCEEDASMGGVIFTNALAQKILLEAGAADLLKKRAVSTGPVRDFLLACPAFNDPSQLEPLVMAKKSGKGYKLSGRADYVVLGAVAGQALVPARQEGKPGYTWFLVDTSVKGVSVGEPVFSLGFHACPAADMEFDNAPAKKAGEEGLGERAFEKAADQMAAAAAAMSLGIMKGSFKTAANYAKKRFQGGREIIHWSEVRMILANMATRLKVAELAVSRALKAVDDKEERWQDGARAAALWVQDMACEATTDGIQILGGVGYMKDHPQEKRFRDAKHAQALMGIVPLKKLKFVKEFTGLKT